MAWTAPRTWTTGELATAAMLNTDHRDNLQSLGRDAAFMRNVGTAGGLGERWYLAGAMVADGQALAASVGPGIGTFAAVPFVSPRGGTLDRIAFNVTTGGGAGSVARVGIYSATSATNLYPGSLVVDGGEFVTTSTGIKAATISTVLSPDVLYWAVYLAGVAAPTINVHSNATADFITPVLGINNAFGDPSVFITRTQAYGALPGTFPAGPPTSFAVTNTPAIALRYSA